MTKKELQTARQRIYHHVPPCTCGDTLIDFRNTNNCHCDECGRVYLQILASATRKLKDGMKMVETVNVVFNGNITTKTFTWEL